MKIVRYSILIIVVILLSTVIRWFLPPAWLPIDFFLLAVVLVALRSSNLTAQLFGLTAGLAQDVFSAGIIGVFALSKITISFVIAGLQSALMIRGTLQRTIIITLATIADAFIVIGINEAFGVQQSLDFISLTIVVVANTIAGLFAVIWLKRRIMRDISEKIYEST